MSTGSTLPFAPSGTTTIAGSVASNSAALTTGDTVVVYNAAATLAFVAFGNGAATATVAAGYPVPPGATRIIFVGPIVNFAAAILASATGNVYFSAGTGTVY
jgi:hypothetical protein